MATVGSNGLQALLPVEKVPKWSHWDQDDQEQRHHAADYLADEYCDTGIVASLRTDGHDVAYVPERQAGISDDEVLPIWLKWLRNIRHPLVMPAHHITGKPTYIPR